LFLSNRDSCDVAPKTAQNAAQETVTIAEKRAAQTK